MRTHCRELLQKRLDEKNLAKLLDLNNPKLNEFVAESIELCNPDSVFVCTDAAEDFEYIRASAVERGEEKRLAIKGHTVHFDGFHDQARDKANTKYLVARGAEFPENLNTIDKAQGLAEIKGFLADAMRGKEMIVRFACLGPKDSEFSISGVQVTDSFYVAHSVDLLYRPGYEQFKSLPRSAEFFRVLHSAGALEGNVSADVYERRIYIDPEDEIVYSVNTQYAGNTIGFKKLLLRLAIRKADREGWLAEHMFLMGVHGPGGRTTYFSGAYPSACGKTATSMVSGETIVGDDLAYLRKKNGCIYAANVERGIFGIIRDVNAENDPLIWRTITTPGEVIFSNVLVSGGRPYWLGDGREHPKKGINYSGKWYLGKKDSYGKEIPPAHKNARYTIRLSYLDNLDARAEDPEGVPLGGIIYGGRDSDTWVPVQQSFDWDHGVITMGASLESETTSATLGKEGIRTFQPMSNIDFLSLPLGRYVKNHLDFVNDLTRPAIIFAVNYFLKGADGCYLNGVNDKRVWLKWMELRVHDDVGALTTPTGYIPRYDDLKKIFKAELGKNYTRKQYEKQFTLRIRENLDKIDRIKAIYREHPHVPEVLFKVLDQQRKRLRALLKSSGTEYVSPFVLERLGEK